ncbi:NPCBM/NEW2 domain-containing protein [Chamaesiphon sp.]|uniref:NPCBM/NEW2 domain-containing protein n=1 Tax=Chamaesiphon sp. TaxID=2814140 RepID=UPI0035935629
MNSDNYFANQTVESLLTPQQFANPLALPPISGRNLISPHTIAFVDPSIDDARSVMANLKSDVKIFLDPTRDGITQITEALKNYRGLSGIDIISHGSVANLQLGNSSLNANSLSQYTHDLQQWKTALSSEADILIYGCNVAAGASGQAFIDKIGNLTGADVAASRDLTGNAARGGNWNLEYATGSIETQSPFSSSFINTYSGLLATIFLSDLTATAATNGWGAIERDKSNGEQGATDGNTLTLNGVTYAKGLGVHASSDTTYALGGNYTRFISDIGVDDEVGNNGSVVFQVLADGVQIYDSGLMTGATATKTLDLDVTGKQNLRLIVTDGGNGVASDHADWANARLESGPPAPDTTAPTATLTANPFTTTPNSTTPYTFTVTYSDNAAVNVSTLDSTDLLVTGPNSYSQLATFISATPTTNGSPVTATYRIAPPGGGWDANEAGTYTVAAQSNQVRDTSTNPLAAATLGTFSVAVSNTTTTFLSDLTATAATNGYGAIERDKSNGEQGATDGNTLTLNGVTYAKGLGVHAGSDTTYALGGNYNRFRSDIGVDDEVGNNGSVVFQVLADGVQIYDSGLMTGATATKTVDVDVTGKQNLRLIVTDGGNGIASDHGDWANARLTSAPVGPDNSPPTPTLTAATINTSISAPYTFSVVYTDATAVNVSTINGTTSSSDIRVTGPNGFSQLAQLVSVTPNTNNPSVTATYQITAPDGIWNWNDRGTYTATLFAGEVRDTLGNTTTADTLLGTFQNTVESIFVVGNNSSQVTEGGIVNILINRQGDTTGTATLEYFTGGNSTAVPNVNYVPLPLATLTFAPGETQKTIAVQTLNDNTPNTDKTVSLLIQNPTGADLGPSRTASIAIKDNAGPVLTYLSDLPFATSTNGWGPVERDKSNGEQAAGDGATLSLGGVSYAKGVGVHANSQITYNLGGAYNSFFAYVGVDDEVGVNGSIVFQILADGLLLFDSGVMTGLSNTQLANVDVTGKQTLTLIVNDSGNGGGSDHGDWASAQLVVGAYTPPPPPLVALPREQVVGGLNQPTNFDWSPDGRLMFVAEQSGVVRTVVQTPINITPVPLPLSPGLRSTPFIDISSQVNNVADRGLLGLAVDPSFGKNQGRDYVYLLFTYDPPQTQGQTGLAAPDGSGNRPARLIRVTADPSTNYTTALANSEVVLLGKNSLWQYTSRPDVDSNIDFSTLPSGIANGSTITPLASLIEDPDDSNIGRDYSATDTNFENNNNIRDYLAGDSTSHSVGQLKFGLDGSLFVTVGDGTSYNGVDWRSTRVQDVDNLSGKLLRINPLTGEGYADNPFTNGNLDSNRSKVWSLGLRNPFRFTINPTTGTPYLGDVGWNTWEEIDVATKGANFGWPYFEGPSQNLGYSTLPQAQAFYNSGQTVTGPLLTRNHAASQNADGRATTALIMGDFYTGNTLPSIYNGALFYNDVGLGTVYTTFFNPNGTVKSTQVFDNLPYIVKMQTGPDGNLYYASLYGGDIGRWKPA